MLLNLLITIMAEARERAREDAHLVAKYRRAKLVVDHESMVLDDVEKELSMVGTAPTFLTRCYLRFENHRWIGPATRWIAHMRLFSGERIDRELVMGHQEPWIHMLCPVKLDSADIFGLDEPSSLNEKVVNADAD